MIDRLASYGTLAPGQENHDQVAGIAGTWSTGTVRGYRYASGVGEAHGYPGLVLDPAGAEVTVRILASDDLARHWPRLDDFEGEGYRRVRTTASTPEGGQPVWVYILAEDAIPQEMRQASNG